MPVFRSSPDPDPATGLPPARRISLPASERLSTITEGPRAARSGWRSQAQTRPASSRYAPSYTTNPNRWSSGNVSQATTVRTAPPAYGWVPEHVSVDGEDLRAPVEGEKLAQLRNQDNARRDGGHKKFRGGWGRLLIIILAVLIVLAIALGVGLGVGLRRHHANGNENDTPPSSVQTSIAVSQPFPLGQYSMATVLRSQNTDCTSNAATWRCYPYVTYSPSDPATNTTSLTTFNWALANTSSTYPSNTTTTMTTSAQGVDSNLTISSVTNPFAISFSDKPLTYIHTSANASSARLTFTFEISKSVLPAIPITSNNAATICFFNSTVFTGTLYLDSPATFPTADTADNPGVGGGYTPWPYAIEISQSSPSGTDVPACYLTVNGNVGARILSGPAPVIDGGDCLCDYRNF